MSEDYGSDPRSVEEASQPPPAPNNRMISEQDLQAETKQCVTTEAPEVEKIARTRPNIPPAVSLDSVFFKRFDVYTQEQKAKAWSDAAGMVQTYSDEMIKRWKEEIDTYLVFAGLFSAVLTTFNVQSYLLLQPAAPDPTIAVLQQISSQLASFSINPPFINSTQPFSPARAQNASAVPPVPRWAVWLNALWFSGLIISLSSASVGIMAKQWLNEYSSGVSGTSRPVARLRQYRLNNLRTWRVEDIIGAIPILLQLALALFLSGILILLWTLQDTVAAIASTLVGFLAVFTVVVTLLPLINHECSYLTPQVRAVNAAWQPKRYVYWVCTSMFRKHYTVTTILNSTRQTLSTFCQRGRVYLSPNHWRSLSRQVRDTARNMRGISFPPETWKESNKTWKGRERSTIDQRAGDLDKQTLLEAYSSTLHRDALSAASVCLMGYDSNFVIDYFRQLLKSAREHFGAAASSEDGPLGNGNPQKLLWLHIILCVLWQRYRLLKGRPTLSEDEATALGAYFKFRPWSSSIQAADAEWAVSTCNAILDYLETARIASKVTFVDKEGLLLAKRDLIYGTISRDKPLTNVLLQVVTAAYRQVRLTQSCLAKAPSDDAKDAHTRYLKSAYRFLRCAKQAFESPLPADDLETVYTYIRDVLAELTSILLKLFAEGKVRATIESTYLCDVMQQLGSLDDARVEQCVADGLVPHILRLMGKLETTSDSDDNRWTNTLQDSARVLKEKIIRVTHNPGTTPSPEPSHVGSFAPEATARVSPAIPHSSSAVDPRDDSQKKHTADPSGAA